MGTTCEKMCSLNILNYICSLPHIIDEKYILHLRYDEFAEVVAVIV